MNDSELNPIEALNAIKSSVSPPDFAEYLQDLCMASMLGSRTQAAIFLKLYETGGQPVSGRDLADQVFDGDYRDRDGTLRVHLHYLRNRLREMNWGIQLHSERTPRGGTYTLAWG